jgi:hypothetical protein
MSDPKMGLWSAQIPKTQLKRAYHPIFNRYLLKMCSKKNKKTSTKKLQIFSEQVFSELPSL